MSWSFAVSDDNMGPHVEHPRTCCPRAYPFLSNLHNQHCSTWIPLYVLAAAALGNSTLFQRRTMTRHCGSEGRNGVDDLVAVRAVNAAHGPDPLDSPEPGITGRSPSATPLGSIFHGVLGSEQISHPATGPGCLPFVAGRWIDSCGCIDTALVQEKLRLNGLLRSDDLSLRQSAPYRFSSWR